jgi:hypothetical protein
MCRGCIADLSPRHIFTRVRVDWMMRFPP